MTCTVCGGPIKSKRNISGICNSSPKCRRAAQRSANGRYHQAHPGKRAERWAAYGPGYQERRAQLDAQRRQDSDFRERVRAAVQAYKTDPANAERVRGYNRRGRVRYMSRADRRCLVPGGKCTSFAKVGSKFCAEHQRSESNRQYHRTAAQHRQDMAESQSWLCPWCQDYLPPTLSKVHVDHIIPRSSGLVIEEGWNLQLLHGRCNQEKSDNITTQAVELAAEHGLFFFHMNC